MTRKKNKKNKKNKNPKRIELYGLESTVPRTEFSGF